MPSSAPRSPASIAAAPAGSLASLPGLIWLTLMAITVPTLLGYSSSPSVTFLNQALSLFGWAVLTVCTAWVVLDRQAPWGRAAVGAERGAVQGARPLQGAALLLLAGMAASVRWFNLPVSMALDAAGMLLAGLLVFMLAVRLSVSGLARPVFEATCWALYLAGVCGLLIGLVQAFRPDWCNGWLLASPTVAGKAVGNLRQPNHLATLLVWSVIAGVWLAERGGRARVLLLASLPALVFGVLLTASRTGMVGVGFVAIWAVFDRQLSRPARWLMLALPLVYAAAWLGMSALSHLEGQAFAAEARLHSGSDISSSRFPVWRDTLVLIARHPLTGVGFGNFNLAWTLTPFPQRSVHFFDHTHNLFVQWAVELGLPATAVLCGLLGWAFWNLARQAGLHDDGTPRAAIGAPGARAALMVVIMVGWHSQLEYPLWYAYFLLPTLFVWGLALGPAARGRPDRSAAPAGVPFHPLARAGLVAGAVALGLGTLVALWDYRVVSEIYQPSADAGPLDERIAAGQRGLLFDYQADYAAATTPEDDEDPAPLSAFATPLHHLIDTRLMAALARSLHAQGDDRRAYFVIDRLREFDRLRPEPDPFLTVCAELQPGEERPFQCLPGPVGRDTMDYRDFQPPRLVLAPVRR